ncbi:MAG: ThiF family adenylyltransferase [Gammaproteobacteria bacterium]|jgi:molybdopterin/thiamine biosynthesis adenylyltransferase|nr:ThiF family adenylyltransferase [Gammaproteobacteria bacterium]
MNQKYVLAPYVKVGFSEKGLELGFGSIQSTITSPQLQNSILATAAYFLSPHSLEELVGFLKNDYQLDDISIEEVIDVFRKKNFLIEENIYIKNERYSRHKLFYSLSGGAPIGVQHELSNKHVVILGCGGIGNLIGVNLVTAGVNQLTLIDNDLIELSNLTRQIMFTEEDVGKSKTAALSREFQRRNSNVIINVLNERIDSKDKYDLLPSCDLVVISGDSNGIMNHVNAICYSKKIPFINVGYIQDVAVWGPLFIPGSTACYECFGKNNIAHSTSSKKDISEIMRKINVNYQAPSIGPVNMLASSLATLDILKFLGKFGTAHSIKSRIGLWTHSLEIEKQHNQENPSCITCIQ